MSTLGPDVGNENHHGDPDAAPRVLRPRRAAPADAVRPTRAEVNLGNLRFNLRVLERALEPKAAAEGETAAPRPAIWGVLKADAYGHGAPAIARTLERAGIAGICVALLEEAIELRSAGIQIPILVMGGYYGPRREGLEELLANDLVPVVYHAEQVTELASLGRPVSVHLKVDTGMGRLGASPAALDGVLDALAQSPSVRLEGLMTHLACADDDDLATTEEQLRRFAWIEQRARAAGLAPRIRHAANSAGLLRVAAARLDAVRPGIALFGVPPRAGLGLAEPESARAPLPELRPVMRVRSEIVSVRDLAQGDRIGYGHTWQAGRKSQIATVPMGYADGLSRHLSNKGHALVRGRRVPIVGAVSMDLTMIDVTDVPGARLGDEVCFLGGQEGPLGKDVIGATEIAEHAGTIAWEVLTSISRRVPRFYREP
jgi:alanine racemase